MNLKGNNFRVGERVAVYNTGGRFTGTIHTVDKQYIYVDFDGGGKSISIHHMQCRRLMPKKKNLGDEIWFRVDEHRVCGFLLDSATMLSPCQPEIDSGKWIKYKRCK